MYRVSCVKNCRWKGHHYSNVPMVGKTKKEEASLGGNTLNTKSRGMDVCFWAWGSTVWVTWTLPNSVLFCLPRAPLSNCLAINWRPPLRNLFQWVLIWYVLLCTSLIIWKELLPKEFLWVYHYMSPLISLTLFHAKFQYKHTSCVFSAFIVENLRPAKSVKNCRVCSWHNQGHLWLLWRIFQHELLHLKAW